MDARQKVYQIVSQIPLGKVLTYQKVAKLAGLKSPRLVGKILHDNPDSDNIPCHRVVSSQGKVAQNYAFGDAKGQIDRLTNEGIAITNKRVDLSKYLWHNTFE
jgi:O-6-methylguanine DNA methyltransferase